MAKNTYSFALSVPGSTSKANPYIVRAPLKEALVDYLVFYCNDSNIGNLGFTIKTQAPRSIPDPGGGDQWLYPLTGPVPVFCETKIPPPYLLSIHAFNLETTTQVIYILLVAELIQEPISGGPLPTGSQPKS